MSTVNIGRAPRGARGLKRNRSSRDELRLQSRPARGAWIETTSDGVAWVRQGCRAPRGARGLKRDEHEAHLS